MDEQDNTPTIATLALAIGRIEVKLDNVISKQDDHETRTRSLESFRWRGSGAIAALSATITVALGALGIVMSSR